MYSSVIFQAEVRYWSNRGHDQAIRLLPFRAWNHGYVPEEDLPILKQAEMNDGQNGFYVRIYDEDWNKVYSSKFQDARAAELWLAGVWAATNILQEAARA